MQSKSSSVWAFCRYLLIAFAVAIATPTDAARFTTILDALETRVTELSFPPVEEPPPSKKDARAYKAVLKRLAKGTSTWADEVKTGFGAIKKVGKTAGARDDPDVPLILEAISLDLEAGVRSALLSTQTAIDAAPEPLDDRKASQNKRKAESAVTRGLAKIGAYDVFEPLAKKNKKVLLKAAKDLATAEKRLAKIQGGVDDCPGEPFANGESASVTRNGVVIQFDRWEFERVPQSGSRWFRLYRCDPPAKLSLLTRFPQLGVRDIDVGSNDDDARFDFAFDHAPLFDRFVGTNNITVWDPTAGAVEAAFSFANDSGTFTNGSLIMKDFNR